jgi:hypothetical protein
MKISQVGAESFHVDGQTDRQTDMTELVVAVRNFAKASKRDKIIKYMTFCWEGRNICCGMS